MNSLPLNPCTSDHYLWFISISVCVQDSAALFNWLPRVRNQKIDLVYSILSAWISVKCNEDQNNSRFSFCITWNSKRNFEWQRKKDIDQVYDTTRIRIISRTQNNSKWKWTNKWSEYISYTNEVTTNGTQLHIS